MIACMLHTHITILGCAALQKVTFSRQPQCAFKKVCARGTVLS
jgi:hypothetical protein